METLNDVQILEQIRLSGDEQAFKTLFRKYYKLLNVEAYYILRDEMDAEDIVQGFFVDFWERELYRNINSSVKGYLQISIRNRCLKRLEKSNFIQKKLTDYKHTVSEIEENEPEYQVLEIFPDKMLADFPMQRLQAFTLVHYENKKYKDAAFEMGISINSLKTHLKLAVKILKQRLRDNE